MIVSDPWTPEIYDFGHFVIIDHYVVGFQVSMAQLQLMHESDGIGQMN